MNRLLGVAGALGLAASLSLTAVGCSAVSALPLLPSLPTESPEEIRAHNLVPTRSPQEFTASTTVGALGFRDIERMTVRIRNVRCNGLGTGTGFALDPHTIITNRHVVEGSESLTLTTFDGRDIPVEFGDVKMSDDADIAIISVGVPLDAYVTVRRGTIYQDEPVSVIGFPEGGQMTLTEGAIRGMIKDNNNQQMGSVIFTDAQVHPGSSGSPLLDADAQLIGVIYARTDDFHGLAVPIEMLDNLLAGTSPASPLVSCRA